MSNTLGHNILHQSLLRPPVVEPQSKLNSSGILANTLFQAAGWNQSAAQTRKSPLLTKFCGNNLNVRKQKLGMGSRRPVKFIPRAVLTMDSASEVIFHLLKMAAYFFLF
jgi:alpha-glucan,water dikinase